MAPEGRVDGWIKCGHTCEGCPCRRPATGYKTEAAAGFLPGSLVPRNLPRSLKGRTEPGSHTTVWTDPGDVSRSDTRTDPVGGRLCMSLNSTQGYLALKLPSGNRSHGTWRLAGVECHCVSFEH